MFGFTTKKTTALDLFKDGDSKLLKNVISDDHILYDLLPPKRTRVLRERKHDFFIFTAITLKKSYIHYKIEKLLIIIITLIKIKYII